MAVKVGSARIDENGRAHGGKAGNQTGKELSVQNWYRHSKGWRVLRCTDAVKAEKIAAAMEAACRNRNIGYDQYERLTLYNLAKTVDFDPARVAKPCETDCSALVRVCLAFAGIATENFRTPTQAKVMLATGQFVELTGKKYTDSSDYFRRGDVLVTRTQGHTVVVLSNGSKADYSSPVRVAPSNLYFEPGVLSFDELLRQAGDGIVITEVSGLHAGANPVSGDFSLLSKGYTIKDGQRDQPLERITVAGNFYQLLKDITDVGGDLLFEASPIGSPSVLVKRLDVAGA